MAECRAEDRSSGGEREVLKPSREVLIQASARAGVRRAKRPRELLVAKQPLTPERKPLKFVPSWLRPHGPLPGERFRDEIASVSVIKAPKVVRVGAKQKDKEGAMENLPPGNMPFADYRWWIGAEVPISRFSMCRACREQVYSHKGEGRLLHHAKYKCTLWIVEAASITQRGRQCVMCEKHCGKNHRWGIALCSEGCMTLWMFAHQPTALWLRALALAKPRVEKKLKLAEAEWETRRSSVQAE
jgi:hypothetical protein